MESRRYPHCGRRRPSHGWRREWETAREALGVWEPEPDRAGSGNNAIHHEGPSKVARPGGPRPCYAAGLRNAPTVTKGGPMAVKLYVGGLSYSTTSEALREHFAQSGTVESATVITDRYSGQSRGFGFVEMATQEEAQKAVTMHNGQRLDGRTIKVELANPQGAGGGGGGRGGSGMGGGRGGSGRPPRW